MLIGLRKKLARALDPDGLGRESLDPTPVAIPAGFKRPETLQEQIKRLIQTPGIGREISGDPEAEDFDEANDFDISDDPADPASEHEEFWDPALRQGVTPAEVLNPSHKAGLDKATERAQARRQPKVKSPPAGSDEPAEPPASPAAKPPST